MIPPRNAHTQTEEKEGLPQRPLQCRASLRPHRTQGPSSSSPAFSPALVPMPKRTPAPTILTTALMICSIIWDIAVGIIVPSPWKYPRRTAITATIRSPVQARGAHRDLTAHASYVLRSLRRRERSPER